MSDSSSEVSPEASQAAAAMVGAFASPEAVDRLAATLDALAAVSEGSPEERLQTAAAQLAMDAQSEIDRLRAIEAKFAECVGLIGELNHNHDDRCRASLCLCDHDAREALLKLAES